MLARVAPFVIFLALTFCQGAFGEASRYWFYLIKTILGIGMIRGMWPVVTEMRWAFSWESVVVGVGVCVMWVGLDGHYPSLDQLFNIIGQDCLFPLLKHVGLESWCPRPSATSVSLPWNPHAQFGQDSALAWLFIVTRMLGPSVIVPPLEEVFYRSFLYRYIIKPEFLTVSLGTFNVLSFALTAAVFGFGHHEWLAGILCGMACQGLVLWKKRLGDAMTAHAITNFLLGLWVIYKGAWHFW